MPEATSGGMLMRAPYYSTAYNGVVQCAGRVYSVLDTKLSVDGGDWDCQATVGWQIVLLLKRGTPDCSTTVETGGGEQFPISLAEIGLGLGGCDPGTMILLTLAISPGPRQALADALCKDIFSWELVSRVASPKRKLLNWLIVPLKNTGRVNYELLSVRQSSTVEVLIELGLISYAKTTAECKHDGSESHLFPEGISNAETSRRYEGGL